MPPAIIGAAIALGASAAAAAGIIAASTALIIGMAATAAGALLTKKPSFDFNAYKGQQERKQVLRAAAASRAVVYGKVMTSGVMTFAEEEAGDQDKGEWLHMVLTLAGHPLTRIDGIWLSDDHIDYYGEHAQYELHNNRQTADPFMLKNCPSWKSDMIGKGICWLRLSFKFDAEKYPSGLPNVRVLKVGRMLYDPRSSKMVESSNAALVILDYFRTYLKRTDDQIHWDQFKAAANICDELVTVPGGKSEPRYTINGEFDMEEASSKILDDMLQACGGELTYIGGKHGLLVGAYYGPATMTLDESCIAGNIKIVPETSFKERTNTITGTFIDPLQNYSEVDFPSVVVKEWVEKDGGAIAQDIKYRFVTSEYQAQRLSNIVLRRKRVGRTIEVPCNMRGYKFRPGMYIKVNIAALGIKNVEMRVTKWSFDPKGGVNLTLRQDFVDMWDDAIGKPMERPDLVDLPTGGVAQPQNVQYQVLQISDVVQGVLSWTNSGPVSYNRVAIRQNGVTVWTAQVPGQSVRVTGLLRGAYTAHVQAVAYTGALSPEGYLQFNIQAPPTPTSVEVQNGFFAITLIPKIADFTSVSTQFDFWTSGEKDLNTTNTEVIEKQATRKGMGLTWTENNLLNDHTYYWYVRTINSFGSSGFVRIPAKVHAETGQLIDFVDKTLQGTDSYKNLVAEVQKVEDGVTALNKTVTENDKKYTQSINSVQSSVDGVTVTVQEQASALSSLNGKLSAQWGQKVQIDNNGNKYVAGMQLGIESSGGQTQSYFMVSANNFAVYNPTAGSAALAFAIKNGQAFLREAFIENGSINNAKIGNVIQSNNWNGSNVGWQIDKNGKATFNGVVVRGTVYATDGNFSGTVEAKSFIGDVANMTMGGDKWLDGNNGELIWNFKYTDSTTSTLSKNVMLSVYVTSNVNAGGSIRVKFECAGQTKDVRAIFNPDGSRVIGYGATVSCGFTGITANIVNAKITVEKAGAPNTQCFSPIMMVNRGSGNFTVS